MNLPDITRPRAFFPTAVILATGLAVAAWVTATSMLSLQVADTAPAPTPGWALVQHGVCTEVFVLKPGQIAMQPDGRVFAYDCDELAD
jgi:hypothetical protein